MGHDPPLVLQHQHALVELPQLPKLQFIVITEVKPASAVMVAPAIAITREVYPLWVAKLITHEVQVPITPQYQSD